MQNKSRHLSRILCICFVLLGLLFGAVACSEAGLGAAPIDGVIARDSVCVYDGEYHSIRIENTRDTDVVSYSSNGVYWSEEVLGYSMPGEYVIYYKVSRRGCADLVSAAKLTIEKMALTDITADEVEVVYDGRAHSIHIAGLMDGDKITYSIDGTNFKDKLELTDVGVYTVHYNVERFYGDFSATCNVTILPNINGSYFNPEFGVIQINDKKASVNGQIKNMSYDFTGNGKIEKTDFVVSDNVLVYDGKTFTKASKRQF